MGWGCVVIVRVDKGGCELHELFAKRLHAFFELVELELLLADDPFQLADAFTLKGHRGFKLDESVVHVPQIARPRGSRARFS